MVKLKGPSLAQDAGGSLAGAVTFSKWKGRNYLKRKSIPKRIDSPAQARVAESLGWLSSQWTLLNAAFKDTWAPLAAKTRLPPQQAFLQHNCQRFHRGAAPSKLYPPSESFPYATIYSLPDDGRHNVRSLHRTLNVTVGLATWAFFIWYSNGTPQPWAPNTRLHIHAWNFSPTDHVAIPAIEPGVYQCKLQPFALDGHLASPTVEAGFTIHDL